MLSAFVAGVSFGLWVGVIGVLLLVSEPEPPDDSESED